MYVFWRVFGNVMFTNVVVQLIKGQISVSQLLENSSMSDAQVRHLMNLVMQFRKVLRTLFV